MTDLRGLHPRTLPARGDRHHHRAGQPAQLSVAAARDVLPLRVSDLRIARRRGPPGLLRAPPGRRDAAGGRLRGGPAAHRQAPRLVRRPLESLRPSSPRGWTRSRSRTGAFSTCCLSAALRSSMRGTRSPARRSSLRHRPPARRSFRRPRPPAPIGRGERERHRPLGLVARGRAGRRQCHRAPRGLPRAGAPDRRRPRVSPRRLLDTPALRPQPRRGGRVRL